MKKNVPHKPETWAVDADGYPPHLCTECGTPVLYGTRHTQCSPQWKAAKVAKRAKPPAVVLTDEEIRDCVPKSARFVLDAGEPVVIMTQLELRELVHTALWLKDTKCNIAATRPGGAPSQRKK